MSSKTSTGACLLGIPPELRLIVYSFLRPKVIGHFLHVDADIVDLHRSDIKTTALANLSRSCKRIHFEVNEVLYRNLEVDIYASPHPPTMRTERWDLIHKQLSCFPEHISTRVRSVLLRVQLLTNVDIERYLAFFDWVDEFLISLQSSRKLEEFGFEIVMRRTRWDETPEQAGDGRSAKDREIDRARIEVARLKRRFEVLKDEDRNQIC